MTLFTNRGGGGYSRDQMPEPDEGGGPWGEAIEYWLKDKKWVQADLERAIDRLVEQGLVKKSLTKNTISSATRGFHCATATLEIIATGLGKPLEDVLVSPARKSVNEDRRRLAEEISARVLREIDTRQSQTPFEDAIGVIRQNVKRHGRPAPKAKPEKEHKRKHRGHK